MRGWSFVHIVVQMLMVVVVVLSVPVFIFVSHFSIVDRIARHSAENAVTIVVIGMKWDSCRRVCQRIGRRWQRCKIGPT